MPSAGGQHAHRASFVDLHHSRRLSAHAETRGKSHSTRRRSDMKKSVTFALGLALTAGLAACGQQGETSKPAEDAAAPAKDVGAMAMLAEHRHGKGTGSVARPEGRRVGEEGGGTWYYRWAPEH